MGAVLAVGRKVKKKKMRVNQVKKLPRKSSTITTSEEEELPSYDESGTGEESDYTTTQITTVSKDASDEPTTENRTHSSDTSYGVESLPEVEDYPKWRKNYAKEDEKWVKAIRQFNDQWPVHRRLTKPAKLVRRITVPTHAVGWAKAAREVYKRQEIEWETDEDPEDTLSSLSIHTFSHDENDSWDETSVESRDFNSDA
ncbi:hypothetical protein PRIPAC_70015 [Pristionchus pacificus]|uniref:Uncharacterized protein n=1 Tax=Pristionchus pacificus TaxID=54126 RepID=A0A454XQ62_PRIPA|nr:hypothetical protein PRIPAC_70015 [Pristionchus pacificus]|eukprot:PDM83664.1 hypothetical protein PRIPAC_30151 [Pristionchus pacificus]